MGVALLRREDDGRSVGRFTLDSHHLARLHRFVAQARRRAMRDGMEFTGVAVEIDPAETVSVHAASVEPLVL
jgi:hypothetical protein